MKIRFYYLIISALIAIPSLAQDNLSFRDRMFFGGSFGLMIGTITDIEVSPHVGYYITPRWAAGIGATYEYYNNKYHPFYIPPLIFARLETHIWGGRLFTNYVIINSVGDWIPLGLNFRIFAHTEYEALSYELKFLGHNLTDGRQWQHSVLVGGGLRFPMGRRSSMNLTLLWNLNSTLNNIYGSGPIIRIGFNF